MQKRVAYTAQVNLSLVPFETVTGFGKKRRRTRVRSPSKYHVAGPFVLHAYTYNIPHTQP